MSHITTEVSWFDTFMGKHSIFTVAVLSLCFSLVHAQSAWSQDAGHSQAFGAKGKGTVVVHLFWSRTCPHCAKARDFLQAYAHGKSPVRLHDYELSTNVAYQKAFITISQSHNIEPPAVPLISIGNSVIVGFRDAATTGAEIDQHIQYCLEKACPDPTKGFIAAAMAAATEPAAAQPDSATPANSQHRIPEVINIPGYGEVPTLSLSLPMLTIVLGAIDGFNPCAMWVLVFLIGLLVGMRDHFRMWAYGIVFLATSAVVYLAFMTAWLNVFLFLGSLVWIRLAVGVFALGAGTYYLSEFVRNPDAACAITSPGSRKRIMDRFRETVSERSFLKATAGIIVLAAAVNLIELLCSAGIPAVYTQVLALSDLTTSAYAAYLLLYISVFMLDDMVVFAAAMLTIQATGLTATYARYSHLIGGVVLVGLGILLLLHPEWLSFA